MKLAIKLFLFIFIILIVSVGLIVWINSGVTSSSLITMQSEEQQLLGHKTFDQIDQFLYERYYDMDLLSHGSESRKILLGLASPSEVDAWIGGIAVRRGSWEAMSLIDTKGVVVHSTFADEVGNLMVNRTEDKKVFDAVIDRGVIIYSDLVLYDRTGNSTIIFGAPVRTFVGGTLTQVGVMLGHVSWPVVLEMIADAETEAYLINRSGKVIAHNQFFGDTLPVETTLPVHNWVLKPYVILDRIDGKPGTSLLTALEERGNSNYQGNGWTLVFETLMDEVNDEIDKQNILMTTVVVSMFGMMALGLFLSLYFMVIRPMGILQRMSEQLAKRNFSFRSTVNSSDEIGNLAKTLNVVAVELGAAQEELERQVREKTKDLEEKVEQINKNNRELEKMNQFMVGRELKMVELKKQVAVLSQNMEAKR